MKVPTHNWKMHLIKQNNRAIFTLDNALRRFVIPIPHHVKNGQPFGESQVRLGNMPRQLVHKMVHTTLLLIGYMKAAF